MTWPTYNFNLDAYPEEILRWNAGGRQVYDRLVYAAAIDVWRDGVHLWRSYDPDTGEDLISWTEREYPDALSGYDTGLWAAKGQVGMIDWLIPSTESLQLVGTVRDMRDLLCTALAIGQAPHPPVGLDKVMRSGTLAAKMWRADRDYIVVSEEFDGVVVRAMIGKRHVESSSDLVEWTATIAKRDVREGAGADELVEGSVTFSASSKASPTALIGIAKKGHNISGRPATRKHGTLIWHIAGAPYTLTISKA